MRSSWLFPALLAGVIAGALALRLPDLDRRRMHGDEANQADKAGRELFDQGHYRYDPTEHHGPTLYYLTLPSLWIGSAGSYATSDPSHYRAVPLAFGVGLILLLGLVRDGLGRAGALSAGLLTAVSPAMVFYSRYYIQEMLLVFFAFAVIAAGWRYARTGRAGWLILAGASLGLMHATKETCLLFFVALGTASAVAWFGSGKKIRWHRSHLVAALLTGAAISALFYSSFLTWPQGLSDAISAYRYHLDRGRSGSIHNHSWDYYLRLLIGFREGDGPLWSEGFILLLALGGGFAALTGRGLGATQRPLARFLLVYTVVLTTLYSAIPYKTPWNLLGFWHGAILMAGIGVAAAWRGLPARPFRVALLTVLMAGSAHLAWQAYRDSFLIPDDSRSPYLYAEPDPGVVELAERAEALAAGRDAVVKVIAPSYWPLPWYLRRLPQVGYYNSVPANPDADLVILSADQEAAFQNQTGRVYQHVGSFWLRPRVQLSLYLQLTFRNRIDREQDRAGGRQELP